MLMIFSVTIVAVFTAELIGDKLMYTLCALSTRYHLLPVLCGAAVAFMAKMAAAVLIGGLIAHLPAKLVTGLSVVSFFGVALVLSFKSSEAVTPPQLRSPGWTGAALASFGVVFFSEWGDMGQVTATTLAARYHALLLVWMGATLAMITKAVLVIAVGATLRRRVPEALLRYCGVTLLFSLGIWSLILFATG